MIAIVSAVRVTLNKDTAEMPNLGGTLEQAGRILLGFSIDRLV